MCGRDEWARNGGESAKLNGRGDDVMLSSSNNSNLESFLILKLSLNDD
jgi:hypothetical protein